MLKSQKTVRPPNMAPTMARRLTAARAVLPKWIKPQLTQLVDAAPEGDQWLHEIKFDGYRMHARLDRGSVKLLTRTGLDSHGGSQVKRIRSSFSVFQIRSLSPL
jgi:ATP-dependent DNA ligase